MTTTLFDDRVNEVIEQYAREVRQARKVGRRNDPHWNRTRQAKFLEGKELAAATILARLKK